jgi:Ca2+-binding EF-hand superfamily protein
VTDLLKKVGGSHSKVLFYEFYNAFGKLTDLSLNQYRKAFNLADDEGKGFLTHKEFVDNFFSSDKEVAKELINIQETLKPEKEKEPDDFLLDMYSRRPSEKLPKLDKQIKPKSILKKGIYCFPFETKYFRRRE